MSTFKHVGILLRDPQQSFPLVTLQGMFADTGASVHLLNDETPQHALDLVMAMGGDGTVLKALDMHPDTPVLAINYGTVGFLTAGDRGDLVNLVRRLLAGDYIMSERLLLRCEFPGGATHVINEIYLRSSTRMIRVNVFVNDARIRTIRGDGVIVGTPTGSTGYLLSTGAPIVMPDVQCFVLDGINEYNFSSRALILHPDVHIRLHLEDLQPGQRATLVKDGEEIGDLQSGEELHLHKSPLKARLIFFQPDYFFHNLSSRLSWH